jgi:ribose transport system ATP-binding protein
MLTTPDESSVLEEPLLVLTGISKSYDGVRALSDVSLSAVAGEIHALLGENGAGKSTLMGIAAGETLPDEGTIAMAGQAFSFLTPELARSLEIAIVHQHPALLPDMTIAENIRLAVPREKLASEGSEEAVMLELLDDVGLHAHLRDPIHTLTLASKHLLEVAKALAVRPKILILDEPTAPLGREASNVLFSHIRAAAARGTAIVYITHRLAEVRQLATRVTVLRDGRISGSASVADVTDDELVTWIVGRRLAGSTFPPKPDLSDVPDGYLRIEGLSSPAFSNVSMTARRGEIVGLGGIVGNGQSELIAALAGLSNFEGSVAVDGRARDMKELREKSAYIPADRHKDGLMMRLNVRENAAVSSLPRFRKRVLLSRTVEAETVSSEFSELNVRAPSLEAQVTSLSGGNQQKVVTARALLSNPVMVTADEPTQGVDVGARVEIYRILREIVADGIPVVVSSSDAHELEGICDRVHVLSRGHVVEELVGEDVTEDRIVRAAVHATTEKAETLAVARARGSSSFRRFLEGDYAPVLVLALVILALGAYVYSRNTQYISAFNITSVLMLVAALGFISLGQTIALIVAGIDLSVGPLAGLLVVVGSFFLIADQSAGFAALGVVAMLLMAATVGGLNGFLIRYLRFTPVAATLVTFIALGGVSFVLRNRAGGIFSADVTGAIQARLGPVPWAFVILVGLAVLMEWFLRRRDWGRRLRAIGSDDDAARRLGINVNKTGMLAYVAVSLCVFLGAIVLIAQLGIGDPAQGVGYTLSSVTAVVLGGTSLLGGRGTFVGTLLGAFLVVQVQNATVFLRLDQTWQYFFQGALIMAAAIIYSQVRGLHRAE